MTVYLGMVDARELGIQEDIGKWIDENKMGLALAAIGVVAAGAGTIVGGKAGKIVSVGGLGLVAAGAYTIMVKIGQAAPPEGSPTGNIQAVTVR